MHPQLMLARYITQFKNFRYVMDLSNSTNAVFSKKEFMGRVQKTFLNTEIMLDKDITLW